MNYNDIKDNLKTIYDKIVDQMLSDNYSFLSQICLDTSEFDYLTDTFSIFFEHAFPEFNDESHPESRMCNLLTSVVAVNFGFEEYTENGFWIEFEKKVTPSKKIEEKYRGQIARIIKVVAHEYHLDIDYEIEGESIQKNINAVLVQTFVPYNYLDRFFDYAFSIYDDIRDDACYSDLYGFFEDLSSKFKVPLDSENSQSSELGGTKLINSTKRVMRDRDAFGPILEKIFARIDSNNSWSDETDLGRFEPYFCNWFDEHRTKIQCSKGKRRRNARFFLDEDDHLKLKVPSQYIDDENNCGILILTVSGIRENPIHRNAIKDNKGKKIEEYIFKKKVGFFQKIELELNGRNISPSLNAERYVIFDSTRTQIDIPHSGLMYIAVNKDVGLTAEKKNLYTTTEGTRIFRVEGIPGSTITIDERHFFIGTKLEKVKASIGVTSTGITCQTVDNKLPVLSKHPAVCFDISNRTIEKAKVHLVHNNRKCTRYLSQVSEQSSGSLKLLDVNDIPNVDCVPGTYQLDIQIGKDHEVYKYFLIPGIDVQFEEELYRRKCTSTVKFNSKLIDTKTFNTLNDNVGWEQTFDGVQYSFTLPIPSMKYCLSSEDMFDDIIPYNELGMDITVKCPLFTDPSLIIKYDKVKTYRERDNRKPNTFNFSINGINDIISKQNVCQCTLLLKEGSREEEIFSIDTPSVIFYSNNDEKTILTISVKHIFSNNKVCCMIEKDQSSNTIWLNEGDTQEIDISGSCKVKIVEITEDGNEKEHYSNSFNVIMIKEDTGIKGDCKTIAPSDFLIQVDSVPFYVNRDPFLCMLNNQLEFSEKIIQNNCEKRWSEMLIKNIKQKPQFLKACDALKERIIQDELKRGNKDALANLTRKFQDTPYFTKFAEALRKK